MNHLTDNVRILAPVATVFRIVADATRAPEWIPSLVEVSNVKGSGKDSTYDWVFKMAGVRLTGHSRVTKFAEDQIVEVRSGGMIDSVWTYLFAEEGDHARVHLEIQYEVPADVAGRVGEELLRRIHRRELEVALANLKDLVELSRQQTAHAA